MMPISSDLLDAVQVQTNLLEMVMNIAPGIAREVLGREVKLKRNFWGAWDYRSILMTFEINTDDRREGFHPFSWFIRYTQPIDLVFGHKHTSQDVWEEVRTLHLANEHFFALEDKQKENIIKNFLRDNLIAIREISAQYYPPE